MDIKPKKEVNFGPNDIGLEGDIPKLGKEIGDRKLSPETKIYSDKDLIRQNLHSMIYPQNKTVAADGKENPPTSFSKGGTNEEQFLPDYLKNEPAEIKNLVEKLLEDTVCHGLKRGISEAKKSPPFILDAYHDALTDKMHEELKKRKMI